MPTIKARVGSQNVVRVLSNASSPPTKLLNLDDVNKTYSNQDGMILVWDVPTQNFIMTSFIDSSSTTIEGIAYFTNTEDSTLPTNGALVVSGGVGIVKNLNVGAGVSVVGIATFSSDVDINAAVDILNGLTVSGVTTLASSGGITTTGGDFYVGNNAYIGNNLKVDGTSEFIGVVTFRGGTINIGDETSDDINIGGEFVSDLNPNDDASYDLGIEGKRWRNARFSGLVTTTDLYVAGLSTFIGDVNIDGGVDIDGNLDIDDLYVSGLSTFIGNADFDGDVDVDGHTELDNLRVSGVSTFSSAVDIDSDLDVDGHTELDNLNVSGIATFAQDVFITGDLTVSGDQTIINTTVLEVEDINIGIASTSPKLSNAALDGAGITIHGAEGDKTLTWDNSNTRLAFNTDVYAPNYYTGTFDGPNGVAYFDSAGKLVSGISTESAISTSNYILTTEAGTDVPVWTSTIDGGIY